MELEKHPETETEYWEAIESLGGYIWRGRHDLFSGSVEDPNGDIWESIKNAAQLQKNLYMKSEKNLE